MKNKMAWKNFGYPLKGLIIVDSIVLLFLLVSYPAISSSQYKDYALLGGVLGLIFWGIIGVLVGWIVGKIKNRKKK